MAQVDWLLVGQECAGFSRILPVYSYCPVLNIALAVETSCSTIDGSTTLLTMLHVHGVQHNIVHSCFNNLRQPDQFLRVYTLI